MSTLPLLIVVILALLIGVLVRARSSRRLTIEQSVDRYRRTLSAVHDASQRSRATDANPTGLPPLSSPIPSRSRSLPSASRWRLIVAVLAVATVGTFTVVIAQNRHGDKPRSSAPTTTRPPATTAKTTPTTEAASTTTVPLVTTNGTTGTSFTIGKPTYTLELTTTTGQSWVDARDSAGKSLFTGLLGAGASQSFTASTASIQLGNPAAVTVAVEGTAVPFTLANGNPVTLHFAGHAA